MPLCNQCQEYFEDFKGLALHIQTTHKKKSIWASKVLTDVNRLDRKVSFKPQDRLPYSEQDKINRESCVREISGNQKIVSVYCPTCKRISKDNVESEYADNPMAWRVNNILVKTCFNCNTEKRRF